MACDDDTNNEGAYAYWIVTGLSLYAYQSVIVMRFRGVGDKEKYWILGRWLLSFCGSVAAMTVTYKDDGIVGGFWSLMLGSMAMFSGCIVNIIFTSQHRVDWESRVFQISFLIHMVLCILFAAFAFQHSIAAGICSCLAIFSCFFEILNIWDKRRSRTEVAFKKRATFLFS